ncbi:MAG: carboxypeptidase M32 [Methanothrix sp.]|nr:carboxypeptidase M32 [Methanothrix sp.]
MISLSGWDQDISMPKSAIGYRAKAQGYLEDLKNKKWTDPEFGRLLSIANNGSNWSAIEAANLRLWNRDYNKRIKLPLDFTAHESEVISLALAGWESAREKNNYAIFQPHLKALVDLNKEKARYWDYKGQPYDALLDDLMPGMTVARCDKLFDVIKPQIIELLIKIKDSNETDAKNIYGDASYPEDKQEKLAKKITSALGYDYSSGIMIKTKRHPGTYSIGAHDVRISLRYDLRNPEAAIWTAIHECGHGIAAQQIPDEYYGMPIGRTPGAEMAEAEARLFENNLGHSITFWEYWLPQLKKEFKPAMDSVSLEDMYMHLNRLKIGPMRIGADEVSYILHILIRYEIERDLFNGDISVGDLPGAWSHRYKEYLGVDIVDDINGILQDVHWAIGYFGYFPAYAIASLIASQLEVAMRRDHPELDQKFALGDFSIPATWMREHVYKYGAIYDTPDLIKNVTGNEIGPYDFLNYLNRKYKIIFNLNI